MPNNKTAYLGLSQWSRNDPVTMDDFNSDNAKLDAGVAAAMDGISHVKLGEILVAEEVDQIDIDITSLNISDYYTIRFYIFAEIDSLKIRINNQTANYEQLTGGGWVSNVDCFSIGLPWFDIYSFGRHIKFSCHGMYGKLSQSIATTKQVNIINAMPVGSKIDIWGVRK